MQPCLICDRIVRIQAGTNPYFVTELETGYVVLGDFQFFKGYTLFLCKQHHVELHELAEDFRRQFLDEMSVVAAAVFYAFRPEKMNYELLGNRDRHLHWHLFPRHANDPKPFGPVWDIDKNLRNSDQRRPTADDLHLLKASLLEQLHGRLSATKK